MYKCSLMYGYDELFALHTLLEKTKRKPSILATRILLGAIGVLAIVAGIISIPTMGVSIYSLAPAAGGALMVYYVARYGHFYAKSTAKNMEKALGHMNFVLDKKDYEVSDRFNTVRLNYLDLHSVVYYDNKWFLFRTKSMAYILPEKRFYEGDVAELADFFKAKTGKDPIIL